MNVWEFRQLYESAMPLEGLVGGFLLGCGVLIVYVWWKERSLNDH